DLDSRNPLKGSAGIRTTRSLCFSFTLLFYNLADWNKALPQMIKKLLQRVMNPGKKKAGKKPASKLQKNAQIIPRNKHGIDRGLISSAALKTVEGLQKAGFEAYIVGGAVRDLLLDRVPKDFD